MPFVTSKSWKNVDIYTTNAYNPIMPLQCLTKIEAVDLVRHCLANGMIRVSKHFKEELANDDLDMLDAYHVLRTGNIFDAPEVDIRWGNWKYRIEGSTPDGVHLAIVFCFLEMDEGFLITVFTTH